MNRILDYAPTDEEIVISRVLVSVHKAVDKHFPDVGNASRQFTKTVFSDDSEATAIGRVPGTDLPDDSVPPPPQFRAQDQDRTEPNLKKSGDTDSSAEPALVEAKSKDKRAKKGAKRSGGESKESAKDREPDQFSSRKKKDHSKVRSESDEGPSFFSQLDPEPVTDYPSAVQGFDGDQTDWPSIVISAILVAGLVMLGYVYLSP